MGRINKEDMAIYRERVCIWVLFDYINQWYNFLKNLWRRYSSPRMWRNLSRSVSENLCELVFGLIKSSSASSISNGESSHRFIRTWSDILLHDIEVRGDDWILISLLEIDEESEGIDLWCLCSLGCMVTVLKRRKKWVKNTI